jgi:predicted phage baseplate assembly protein
MSDTRLSIPHLDNKTFDQLVREGVDRIPDFAPQWTDHNMHDPGITMVELFAWLAEMQLYTLDQVQDHHLLKYLALVDSPPQEAQAAEVEVTCYAYSAQTMAAGTAIKSSSDPSGPVFETTQDLDILPLKIEKVVSYFNYRYMDVTNFNTVGDTFYHAYGEEPGEEDALYIGFSSEQQMVQLSGMLFSLGIHLYEKDLPEPGKHGTEPFTDAQPVYPTAETVWQYWNGSDWGDLSVEAKTETIVILSQSGRLSFEVQVDWTESGAQDLPNLGGDYYWIRCKVVKEGYELSPRIDRVVANAVLADHGETFKDKSEIGKASYKSSGLPDQVFYTKNKPVLAGSVQVTILPNGGNPEIWERVPDFDASKKEDHHYVMDTGEGSILFGNGLEGAVPPKDAEIEIGYRKGGGKNGNVPALYLDTCDIPNVMVSNHYASTGGTDEETIMEAFSRFQEDLDIPYTAVTGADFETIAKGTPGLRVARARAIIANLQYPNQVTLVVVPYSFSNTPLPGQGFKQTVCRHVDKHRLITTDLKIKDPDYVTVSVYAEISIHDRYSIQNTDDAIKKALAQFLSPLKRKEGENEWPFGRGVFISEISALIDGIDGVNCVIELSLKAEDGIYNYQDGNIMIGKLSLVTNGTHQLTLLSPGSRCVVGQKSLDDCHGGQ